MFISIVSSPLEYRIIRCTPLLHKILEVCDLPAMPTGRIDRSVLAAYHKVIDVTQGERHGSDCYRLRLLKHQLHTVL